MNLLKALRFGGVFGGVAESGRITAVESKGVMVRPGRFERPTFCSGGKRSIQLSYGRPRLPFIVKQTNVRFVLPCHWTAISPRRGG